MQDYTIFLWVLKLGAVPNLYFFIRTASMDADATLVVPALVFFAVAAYRCLFPVHYEHDVVFHVSPLSSVLATRLLATFAELAFTFLLACILWRLNLEHLVWVDFVARYMVLQMVACQVCVWVAILTEQYWFDFYEELGWAFMIAAHATASAYLYLTVDTEHGDSACLPW